MKATKNKIPKIISGLALGLACGTTAMAQSSDALIDKLVDKGILTVKEANALREETDKDFTKAYSAKNGMPEWVNSMKLSGDIRGRFDKISGDNGLFDDGTKGLNIATRERFRYRLRVGATVNMTDNFEAGFRLASGDSGTVAPGIGAGSPLSANSTMNNDANRKGIFIDLAYGKWTPIPGLELQFGKMQNAFWMSPLVMDPDYNPEGAQEKFVYDITDKHALAFTSGQWVIAENSGGPDTFLFVNQIDWTAKWSPKFSTRAGLGFYNFADQSAIPQSLETYINQNGVPAAGNLNGYGAQDFNPIIARLDATYMLNSFPLYKGEFPITPSVEYAYNPGATGSYMASGVAVHEPYSGKANTAYSAGVTFGSTKLKGNWQVSYAYKNIEAASLWHGINDDDFGFASKGGTDVRGHQIEASYKIANPFTVGLKYFKTEQINNSPGKLNEQDRLMVDLMWNF